MSRVQLALNVNDIDEAVRFYTALFGTGPAKRRPGYANFAVTEPPLKLVLLENPGQGGTLNHLGVEVDDAGAVDAEQARLA
ncbi:MAG TPA: VOC family protein, partial [Streptosporangiaceae bacterium]|nr:VOC family protein [Streptosporangiaceae bacterium]